ncbi:MAG: hypothetical protein U0K47_00470 [Erysipelotrichaceae bacterium]|nr:hypothetical protein [Erysipelotrichaceae bacterium]
MQDSDKKNRKKIWLHCIVFFVVLAVLLDAVSQVFLYTAVDTQNAPLLRRNGAEADLLAQEKDSIDVLVIGDSEAFSSFSPLQVYHYTGITSYVAAQPSQTMAEMKHMLHVGLSTQHPHVVMLETDALYRDASSLTGMEDILEEDLNRVFPVFQFHNLWKMLGSKNDVRAVSWKGYYLNKDINAFVALDSYMTASNQQKKLFWLNMIILNQIRQEVKDAGAQLVLYSSASPVNYTMAKHNYLKNLAEDWGITYIDCNMMTEKIGIDWSKDTRDKGDHLNDDGAWKVTDYMISILETMDLPDHRGDPAYSSWDEMTDQFLELVNANLREISKKR